MIYASQSQAYAHKHKGKIMIPRTFVSPIPSNIEVMFLFVRTPFTPHSRESKSSLRK